MAPQTNIPTSANVLGTAGTVCWCIQLIPQIVRNYRVKNTEGLPSGMMLTWASCAIPMGAYLIIQNANVPVQVQAQIFSLLTLITWAQVMVYSHNWRASRATIMAIVVGVIYGAIEALLIFTLRIPYSHGVEWPVILIGVIAAVLLVVGLLLPYAEVTKRHGRVLGINFLFLFIDWLGAVLSFASIAVQHSFDILASVLYILIIVLEAGLFVSHWVWMFRFRDIRKEAKKVEMAFEEMSQSPRDRKLPAPSWLSLHCLQPVFSKLDRFCKREEDFEVQMASVEEIGISGKEIREEEVHSV